MARILLVDDEYSTRRPLYDTLVKAGHAVSVAEEGQLAVHEALLVSRGNKPIDLLVTDRHMPKVDGMDMIVAMAYARCLPERVIVLSRDFVSPGKADVFSEKLRALVPKETKFNFLALAKPIPENQLLYAVVHMLEDRVE